MPFIYALFTYLGCPSDLGTGTWQFHDNKAVIGEHLEFGI